MVKCNVLGKVKKSWKIFKSLSIIDKKVSLILKKYDHLYISKTD